MRTLDTRKNSMRLAVSKWWEHPKLNTRWVGGRTAQAPLDLARAAVGRAVVAVVVFTGEGAAEAEQLEEAGGIGPCGVDVAIGGRAGIRNRQPGHGLHRGAGADERRVDLDEAVAGAVDNSSVTLELFLRSSPNETELGLQRHSMNITAILGPFCKIKD